MEIASAPDLTLITGAVVGDADPEIVALEARLRAAQLAADVAALDALIADGLLFTGPDGRLGTTLAETMDMPDLAVPPGPFLSHRLRPPTLRA
jgi:hypothetical protein